MKKILLVQASQGRQEAKGFIYPIGLCYLATPLVDTYDVRILDLNLHDQPYEKLRQELDEFKPHVTGLSIRNIDSLDRLDVFYYYKTVPATVEIIKQAAPDSVVVAGGSGFSMFAREIMAKVAGIDFGIYLEGEESFPELVENLENPHRVSGLYYRRDGEIQFTGPRPLPEFSSMPAPVRYLADPTPYPFKLGNVGIQTKRGCPLNCLYCSYPFLNGKRLRMRSAAQVVDEIEGLINDFGVREFMFVDGVFNAPVKQAIDICKEISRRGLEVRWKAWCEIKNFSQEFMDAAYEAGCRSVTFSPDGSSDEALRQLGKGITVPDILEAARVVKPFKDVKVAFGFFCTPPGQTYSGLLTLLYLYFKLNIDFLGRGGASMGWMRIEPHTGLEEIAIKQGVISKGTDLLPESEEELVKLFYTSQDLPGADRMVQGFLYMINKVLKPVLQTLYRLVKKKKELPPPRL